MKPVTVVLLLFISTSTLFAGRSPIEPAARVQRCTFIGRTLCDAVHDKPVVALALIHLGALLADGVQTDQRVKAGQIEMDPIARRLIGARPTWERMAPVGAAWLVGEAYIAVRMRQSHNRIVRKLWFVPQSLGIAGNSTGAIYEARHRW